MSNKVIKNYTQIDNKLRNNFDDVKYLIGYLNYISEQIKLVNERIDRIQTTVNSTYEG